MRKTKDLDMKFQQMLGFELRAVLYGNDIDYKHPFVDLRRKDGIYTVNAVHWPYEHEITIGKRWYRRDIPAYVATALKRLEETKVRHG